MLEIKDLYVSYGMMEVLHGVSVNVEDKELVSIIGPNGAGKTTLIKTVMGLVRPTSGSIIYNGEDITHVPAHKRAGMGIGYVPEGRRVFGKLSVDENLRMGAYGRAFQTAGIHHVRRRAADAGHRQGTDAQPEDAPD